MKGENRDMTPEGLQAAVQMDAADELAPFRSQFVSHDPDLLYMDGNSLGRMPRATAQRLQQAIDHEWAQGLVRSWNNGWYEAPQKLGDKIGRLIGAGPGQVVVCDSTSVNLFKLAVAALSLRPGRQRILTDAFNFPSDLYVLQGCIDLLGGRHSLQVFPSQDGIVIDEDALLDAIDEDTALVTLSHVAFKSGFRNNAQRITQRAHAAGALVLWDLSHSAGAVPVDLDGWGVDFAVGCTYKYLNGGPGSPAYLYVRRDLQTAVRSPIWGWFGQHSPFAFEHDYRPVEDVRRFLAGTPPILSLLAIEPGVDLLLEAGIDRIFRKAVSLTSFFIELFDRDLSSLGFTLGSPRSPDQRGAHISLRHPQGYQINRALIEEMNVIPDFREPDNIRLGLAPLYTSYQDVWETVQRLKQVVVEKRFEKFSPERQAVT